MSQDAPLSLRLSREELEWLRERADMVGITPHQWMVRAFRQARLSAETGLRDWEKPEFTGTSQPSKVTRTRSSVFAGSSRSASAGSSSPRDAHEHDWRLLRTFGPLKNPRERWRCEVCQAVEDRAGK